MLSLWICPSDMVRVGERGAALSGGRQRIAIARDSFSSAHADSR